MRAPPEEERAPFVSGLIQGMGGGALDLQRPPTARRIGSEGAASYRQTGQGNKESTPPPLGDRGEPEEQTQTIVAQIVNSPLGHSSPSGKAPVPHTQHTRPNRGVKVQGDRDRISGGRGDYERGT